MHLCRTSHLCVPLFVYFRTASRAKRAKRTLGWKKGVIISFLDWWAELYGQRMPHKPTTYLYTATKDVSVRFVSVFESVYTSKYIYVGLTPCCHYFDHCRAPPKNTCLVFPRPPLVLLKKGTPRKVQLRATSSPVTRNRLHQPVLLQRSVA